MLRNIKFLKRYLSLNGIPNAVRKVNQQGMSYVIAQMSQSYGSRLF